MKKAAGRSTNNRSTISFWFIIVSSSPHIGKKATRRKGGILAVGSSRKEAYNLGKNNYIFSCSLGPKRIEGWEQTKREPLKRDKLQPPEGIDGRSGIAKAPLNIIHFPSRQLEKKRRIR